MKFPPDDCQLSPEEQEKVVDEQLALLKKKLADQMWRDHVADINCIVCGEQGSDVISFEHQRPAHDKCLKG